jgi:ribonuclease R
VLGRGFPRKEPTLAAILEAAKNTPREEIVNYMILRSLKQARYSVENVGHFGLASKCYTHFTSPIRRYPDLVVHRMLKDSLDRRGLSDIRLKELNELLPEIAFGSSRMERRADEAERSVLRVMKAWFMKDRVGEEFAGKIIGITSYGMRVRFEEVYIEGFLHLSSMTDDFYVFDEKSFTLSGRRTGRRFRIGDDIAVRVDRVDMDEREVVLGI